MILLIEMRTDDLDDIQYLLIFLQMVKIIRL